MNIQQLTRAISSNRSNGHVIADLLHPAGYPISLKMGGRKVSFRRQKAALKAAKTAWPAMQVFFREGGTLLTPELAEDWQQHNASHGYWWPALAKWAAKAARTAERINAQEE